MKGFEYLGLGAITSFLLSGAGVTALPSLIPRGVADIAGILKTILGFVDDQAFNQVNAWEMDKLPNMCQLVFSTHEGGGCKASVTCADGAKREYNEWNVCFVGGRQFFTDPEIGEFSLTWRDGSRGLSNPLLQVKAVGDWQEWEVGEYANTYREQQDYDAIQRAPNLCKNNNPYDSSFNYEYTCGVPKIGTKGGGIQSDAPLNDKGYAPGWCGLHVTQYQKPDPSKDPYKFDVQLKDHNGDIIGEVLGAVGDKPISVTSKLPFVFVLTPGAVDADAVLFDYADQHFGSNDQEHHCNFGGYEDGNRDGDCGFTC